MNTATLDPIAKSEHAAVDERAAQRKQRELQVGQLQRQVDNAANELATAEARANQFRTRIKELTATAEILWSQTSGAAGISPVAGLAECYTNITALEQALLHFPDVKKRLIANLDEAKRQLAEFQRRSPR